MKPRVFGYVGGKRLKSKLATRKIWCRVKSIWPLQGGGMCKGRWPDSKGTQETKSINVWALGKQTPRCRNLWETKKSLSTSSWEEGNSQSEWAAFFKPGKKNKRKGGRGDRG